ncbi:MAG: hypothetical protein QOI80_1677 [Solirubrobacteraceae bacterium]|jgi:hypothetical protein|nr:hypothetical protein [Solirubrobacteraceae bacterium]
MSALTPFSPSRRKAYTVINTSTAPVWLAMIVAPRSRLTRWLVARSTVLLVGLGVSYDALLSAGMVQNRKLIDFRDPDAVRAALATPDTFLAGWAHYLAFDLFVGRWIWEDALADGRRPRLALLLTWLAGPAGLTLHLAQRRKA